MPGVSIGRPGVKQTCAVAEGDCNRRPLLRPALPQTTRLALRRSQPPQRHRARTGRSARADTFARLRDDSGLPTYGGIDASVGDQMYFRSLLIAILAACAALFAGVAAAGADDPAPGTRARRSSSRCASRPTAPSTSRPPVRPPASRWPAPRATRRPAARGPRPERRAADRRQPTRPRRPSSPHRRRRRRPRAEPDRPRRPRRPAARPSSRRRSRRATASRTASS